MMETISMESYVQYKARSKLIATNYAFRDTTYAPLKGGGGFESSSSSLGPGKNLDKTSWPRVVAQW